MEKKINNDGFGLLGLLTVLFIGLKLTGNINWSWLWVLSPIWISVVLSIILVILFYPVFKEMYKE